MEMSNSETTAPIMECTYFLTVSGESFNDEIKPVATESQGMPKRINRLISSHERAIKAYEWQMSELYNKMMENEHYLKHQMKKLEDAIIHQTRNESENLYNMVNRKLAQGESNMANHMEETVHLLRAEFQREHVGLNERIAASENGIKALQDATGVLVQNLSVLVSAIDTLRHSVASQPMELDNPVQQPGHINPVQQPGHVNPVQQPDHVNPCSSPLNSSRQSKQQQRKACEFCGKELSVKYLKTHIKKSCPKRNDLGPGAQRSP